jgi:1,2-dihydroxy-3-keto-5-methylthiopentene dioxygenase
MTTLTVFDETGRGAPIDTFDDPQRIGERLAGIGVGFERHVADVDLPGDADAGFVQAGYRGAIDALRRQGGYRSVDVVRLLPDSHDRVVQRAKFLAEHTHDDDEVRFFVEGGGTFYLRATGRVIELQAARGDLIRVPAGARHWFDTGARPFFTAIRLFTREDGWVASFTGDDIAGRFVVA